MNVDVDGLRAAAEAATAGPWSVGRFFWKIGSTRGMADEFWISVESGGRVLATMPEEAPPSAPNATYIAAVSPDVMLGLLDRLQAAEAAVERVRALGEACAWMNFNYGDDDPVTASEAAKAIRDALAAPLGASGAESDHGDHAKPSNDGSQP